MNNQIQLVLKSSTTELSLNDHELGIYLVPELDGLTGLPEIRTTSGVNSGYDGGWTSAQHYDARSITIRGVIANTDVATVERLRKQLVSLAGQGKQEELTLDLVTEAGNAYTLQVRTIALEMAMKGVLEKQEFMLQLRADDPLIYDNAESTHEAYIQVSKATGGFTIDFNLPLAITGGSEETVISNDGLEQVPTITRLYGELHNPKIINQTTNQSMQINADLGFSEGQWVDASEVVTGKTINIEDAPDNAPLASFQLDGETSQNGTPTPSVPVPVKVVTGENVVKIFGMNMVDFSSQAVSSSHNLDFTTGSNGSVSWSGTPNTAWTNITSDFTVNLPAGDYTFSIDHKLTYRIYIHFVLQNGTNGDWILEPNNTSMTRNFGSGIKTVRLALSYMTVGTAYSDTILPQLEIGATPHSYEPYQGQSYTINLGSIELCKIGDYQDSIYKSGDKWYVHKATKKLIYNGTEAWNSWYNIGNCIGFYNYSVDDAAVIGGESAINNALWCNMFSEPTTRYSIVDGSTEGIKQCGGGGRQYMALGINKSRLSDYSTSANAIASLKTWLAANPTTVYHTLATPTDTEITNEALIEQLDALLNTARTYAGVNNIFTVTPNEQGTLEISYYTHKTADNRDEIVIDSRLRTVALNGLDIYHLIETGSEFLMLAPGENKLSLQSDITGDNGYAEVSYKQGYLSI